MIRPIDPITRRPAVLNPLTGQPVFQSRAYGNPKLFDDSDVGKVAKNFDKFLNYLIAHLPEIIDASTPDALRALYQKVNSELTAPLQLKTRRTRTQYHHNPANAAKRSEASRKGAATRARAKIARDARKR